MYGWSEVSSAGILMHTFEHIVSAARWLLSLHQLGVTNCYYIQELWVQSECRARGKHGPDGWRELTLEERKSSLLALWKVDHKKVKKKESVSLH